MNTHTYDVIVIGAGASGMMAAGTAAREGRSVLIIEKNNEVGKKLSITGGGRCNITNAEFNTRTLLTHYGDADKFLFSAFNQFSVKETFDFFAEKGIDCIIEERKRAFPKSEKATDVTKAMKKYISHKNITLVCGVSVQEVVMNDTHTSIAHINTSQGKHTAQHYIFATGGASHPETGSTGDGFNWLQTLEHTVIAPTPGLVPWKVTNGWIREMSGTTLEDISITINSSRSKKKVRGRVLCTHFGLSGPTVINACHILRDAFHSGKVVVTMDMLPHMDYGGINAHLISVFEKYSNKQIKNILKEMLGYAISSYFIEQLPIKADTPAREITREQRTAIVHALKAIPLTVTGFKGYGKSIVVDGGVDLSEIDFKTMKSKKISNLSITGDLLNIRRPSGGYSLQLCWTTGFVAGKHA